MRYIAIGDIHGCRAKLERLLLALDGHVAPEDRFVFIGDYVDRGPDSRGVIEILLQVQIQRPDTIFLRGNHEQMMLEARVSYDPAWAERNMLALGRSSPFLWFANGGDSTIASYPEKGKSRWFDRIPESHWNFVLETTLEFQAHVYHFVHAGLLPVGMKNPDGDVDPRLWIREPFLSFRGLFEGRVAVFGHSPMKSGHPLVADNKLGIDTAAVFGGPLTAVVLDAESYNPAELIVIQAT